MNRDQRADATAFRVAVLFEQAHGYAARLVEPGRLEVVPGGLTRFVAPPGPLTQRDPVVTVYTAAIGFPPLLRSTGVLVRPAGNESGLAMLSHWQRQQLLVALRQAGFDLDIRRKVFGIGQRKVVTK